MAAEEPFMPEFDEPDEEEIGKPASQKTTESDVATTENSVDSTPQTSHDFDRRYLNEKWYGKYKNTGLYVQFVDNEWTTLPEDQTEFIEQLWMEQEASEIQVVDGVRMKWNAEKEQWERMEEQVDEDFIAAYQANYGVDYDYDKMTEEFRAQQAEKAKEKPAEEEEKGKNKKRKGPVEPQPVGWVDMDEKVNAVYVSNLPLDLDEEEFKEFMSKAGIIQLDARKHKPKVKLYRDDLGGLKGDGRCCYVRKESVEIALNILDGSQFKDKVVKVERAHFELKGDFDPAKKPKKMTAAQKKSYMDRQKKLFEWKPEKPRNYRPLSDCTVIIKNLFTIEEMNKQPELIFDLKKDLEQSCSKFGTVKKIVVYDSNPEGVCSVLFENTDASDMAVKMLNGRMVKGRALEAHHWDGRSKYKREETEEERQKRLAEWDRFVGGGQESDDSSSDSETGGAEHTEQQQQ